MENELKYIKECMDKLLKYNELGEAESVKSLALSVRSQVIALIANPPKEERKSTFWERMQSIGCTD